MGCAPSGGAAAYAPSASAYAAGDKVTWTGADVDVPEGSVGAVVGFNGEGLARVDFGRRTWAFPDEQLKPAQARRSEA